MKIDLLTLKKFLLKYILRKKYIRKGYCIQCGSCCQNIYIKHSNIVIKDEKYFLNLQKKYKSYNGFQIIGKDELGLIFKCSHLDESTKKCTNYAKRDLICRRYPQEEIFKMHTTLSKNCGFYFEPIDSFDSILKSVKPIDQKLIR